MKEYRSQSIVVLIPSYGFTPRDIPGIHPTYIMRNICGHSELIFSKLSGFLASAIWGSHAKNFENRGCQLRKGWKQICNPHISPNFGSRELKIFRLLDIQRR